MKNLIILIISIGAVFLTSCGEKTAKELDHVIASSEDYRAEEPVDEGAIASTSPSIHSKAIYKLSQVDVAPLFGEPCQEKEVRICTQRNIGAFIKDNIEMPKGSISSAHSGLEHVKVIIESDGSMRDIKYVDTKKESCDWCQQTAVNVVGKMTQWQPALKNGKPVPVELVIPIKFLG